MAFYMFLSERHGSGVGSRWAFMGLAVKLGISVSNTAGKFCDDVAYVPGSCALDGSSYVFPFPRVFAEY